MKIALIGSAPSSTNLAPYKDKSYDEWLGGKPSPQSPPSFFIAQDWQIWGCSPGAWAVAPRADRWFEVHRWEPGQTWFSPEYTQFLREFRGPVYTGGEIPEILNHEVYPIARVELEFSAYFLHSSLSLMMALAILEIEDARKTTTQPYDDTIGLWGVDMSANEEYGDQRSGCQFFILEALRRGIKIYVPPESCLLRPKPVYGISEWDDAYIKCTARAREFNQRKASHQQIITDETMKLHFMNGAIDNQTYFINTWLSPYGLPAGVYVGHDAGSGLGGGISMPTATRGLPAGFVRTGSSDEPGKGPTIIHDLPGEAVERARLAGDHKAVPGLVDAPNRKSAKKKATKLRRRPPMGNRRPGHLRGK